MENILDGFNASEVEPQGTFEVIPAGRYVAVIIESVTKENSAKTGSFLEMVFQIIEGPNEGRKLWARLNLKHPNETAVKIARAQLSSICRATGKMTPRDSAELHDIPLVIAVRVQKREDTGDMTNDISGYFKKEEGQAAASPQAQGKKAPWIKDRK